MHELAITRDVIDVVVAAANNAQAHEVRRVCLSIGELRDIVDDLFVRCFAHFTKGTIAQGAQVNLNRIPFTVTCKSCGCTYPADIHSDALFVCPSCGKADYELKTGMEFSIDKIEVA